MQLAKAGLNGSLFAKTCGDGTEKGVRNLFPVTEGDMAPVDEAGQGASRKRFLTPFSLPAFPAAGCGILCGRNIPGAGAHVGSV
jgi:hypothetical protein